MGDHACPPTAAALRKALKSDLDVGIVARTQMGGRAGSWMWLTVEQMREVYAYRQVHMAGFKKTQTWAAQRPHEDATNSKRAYAFWYNMETHKTDLPDLCFVGLASAAQWFDVKLLSYQNLKVPRGVTLVSARDILPETRLHELLDQSVPISHIADFVRAMALYKGGVGGWSIDADTLWLRAPEPPSFPWTPPAWGHVFASMHAAPHKMSELAYFQQWSVHFLKKPMDGLCLATPFRFPADSPLLEELAHVLSEAYSISPASISVSGVSLAGDGAASGVSLAESGRSSVIGVGLLRTLIRQHGLEGAIAPPETFAPLDLSWTRQELVGQPMSKSLGEPLRVIMSTSTAVNMRWPPARDSVAHPESFWAKLQAASRACPGEEVATKRRRTGKLPWPDVETLGVQCDLGFAGVQDFSSFSKAYFLRTFLKEGTFGAVYLAQDRLGRSCAIKICKDARGALSGLEVYLQKHCCQHDNVLDVLDAFVCPFYVAIVMPIAKQDLYVFLKKVVKPLSLEVAMDLTDQLAAGLEHIHGKNVIHRDLHSGNILVLVPSDGGPEGGSSISVRVCDFGLACIGPKSSDEIAERLSIAVVGGYNAPPEIVFVDERRVKRVYYTAALDVWCFGCIALEIGCEGVPPFWSRQGRDGIKDKVLELFGSPPDEVASRYRWVGVHGRRASAQIQWGLWRGLHWMLPIQQALRYDMCQRPTMSVLRQRFRSGQT